MKESPEEKRRRLIELAKASVTSAYSTGEHSAIVAINTYNEIERSRNLIHEKLEDWYGIFFPELRLNNPLSYAKFVIEFGRNKKEATAERLNAMLETAAPDVASKVGKSIGNEPTEEEYLMLKSVAEAELRLAEEEDVLDAFLKERMRVLMPNISYLIDYKVAAELLSKAGSLSKLALMPASTIQLLGAEKALFKHIKFHSKPPKYGVLFKLPQITSARREDRGRIARLYATKITIASKADAFTKNFIAEKLKEQIESTIKRYATQNRPAKPERPESQNRRWQGSGNRSGYDGGQSKGSWQRGGSGRRWQDRRQR